MRNNLVTLAGEHDFLYVDITNLQVGAMELNTVRPFFVEATSQLYSLNSLATAVVSGDRPNGSQSQLDSQGASQFSSPPSRPRGEDGAPLSKQFRQ